MLKKSIILILLLCATAQAQNIITRTNDLRSSGRRRDIRWNSYNSIWDRDEAWYEKLYIQMANPITPQAPYYLFEWEFEYD